MRRALVLLAALLPACSGGGGAARPSDTAETIGAGDILTVRSGDRAVRASGTPL